MSSCLILPPPSNNIYCNLTYPGCVVIAFSILSPQFTYLKLSNGHGLKGRRSFPFSATKDKNPLHYMHLSRANQHSPMAAPWLANKNELWTCHPHWWQISLTSLITLHLLHLWIYYSSHGLLEAGTCASLVIPGGWGTTLFCSPVPGRPSLASQVSPCCGARFSVCIPECVLSGSGSHHALYQGSQYMAR